MSRPTPAPPPPAAPRWAAAWAAIVYAVCALSLGYPAFAGRFLLTPVSDQYIGGYAVREFAAHTLRTTGHFPLWNPYLFGGMPYVASMNGDMFYPTFLLRLVLPTDVAMTWSFILHVFLAGLFTYLFLRVWGLGFAASLVGGIAYMMGGPIAGLVSPGHDGKLYVSALLPLVLLLLVRGVRDGKRWSWGALAIAVGLAVLSPHPQLLQYLLLTAGAFAVYLTVVSTGADTSQLDRRGAVTRLALAAGSVALGFAIGAVQYLAVMQYVAWSPRAGGLRSYEAATSYSFPPEELINTYLPQFSGILDDYWGRNGIHFHSEYLGVVVIVLATLGLATVRAGVKRRSFTWFWIGAFGVALLWALGGFTPFYQLVYAIVPGTKFFRAPSTMMFVMAFAVAVLASLGVEQVAGKKVTARFAIGWAMAALGVLLLGATGALTTMGTTLALPARVDAVLANGPNVALGAVRGFAFAALAVGVLFGVTRQWVTPAMAAYALAALVAADLWSVERLYWRFSAPASVLYASDPITAYLNKVDQPVRVLAFEPDPQVFHDPIFRYDGLMIHRIRSALGYHGNELGRYDALAGQLGNPQLWRALNVKYLLTNSPQPLAPGVALVMNAKSAAGSMEYLYEVSGDHPFAWVAPAIVKGPDDAVLTTMLDSRFEFDRFALFDTAAPVQGREVRVAPPPLGITVHATKYEPGHIRLELDRPAPDGAALVVSENYYPGWTANADGKAAVIGRADYVLIGVALPAGARTVELTFASPTYERGKTITLIALTLALLLAAGGTALDRRAARG